MRVLVGGSRSFENYELLRRKMDNFVRNLRAVEVVCGGARGADKLAEEWACERYYKYHVFHADWSKGKGAGPVRNGEMAEFCRAAVFFWDGKSPGTKDCIEACRKLGRPIRVVRF